MLFKVEFVILSFLKYSAISIFCCMLAGCLTQPTTRAAVNSADVRLRYLNQNIELSNSQELTNLQMKVSGTEVYISNYLEIQTQNQEHFKELKMNHFIHLFRDDTEPYTQSVFERSQCLVQRQSSAIVFKSGQEMYWSNCSQANKKYATSTQSVRFWKYCGTTLWEITLKNTEIYNKLSLTCNGIELLNDESDRLNI